MKHKIKNKKDVEQAPIARGGTKRTKSLPSSVWLGIIFTVTTLIYWPAIHNQLIAQWDDGVYICHNGTVQANKLSFERLNLYFAGNWQPGVIAQLWAEYHLFGLNKIDDKPAAQSSVMLDTPVEPEYDGTPYHITSLIMHLLNALFLFLFFSRFCKVLVTGKDIPIVAFIATLIFSIHPMHVESVAWVSETKDVGYAMWYHAALWTFSIYLDKRKSAYLLVTGLLFMLALSYKGQAVTLPLALILVAIIKTTAGADAKTILWKQQLLSWFKNLQIQDFIFWDLAFALSLAVGKIALTAQDSAHALQHVDVKTIPVFDRLIQINYGLGNYILKFVIPFGLSIFHQLPAKTDGTFSASVYLISFIPFLLLFLLWQFRTSLIWVFAIVYFLIHILPVSQVIAVGSSIYWERYTYVAYDGFCLLSAYGLLYYYRKYAIITAATATAFFIFFCYTTFERTRVWHDSKTVILDGLEKNPDVGMFKGWMGLADYQEGNITEAAKYLDECIALTKEMPEVMATRAHIYIATMRPDMGKQERLVVLDSAINDCKISITNKNDSCNAYGGLGICFSMKGDISGQKNMFDTARIYLEDALQFHSQDSADITQNIAHSFNNGGQYDSALVWYTRALKENNKLWPSYIHRGSILYQKGKAFWPEALNDFKVAEINDPDPANRNVAKSYIQAMSAK